jgi:zinc D-Ala-D-Ala carboxypeptidase
MKLTEHFTLEELTASSTAKAKGIDNTPNAGVIEWLKYGVEHVLEPFRVELGKAVIITSGYRCPKLNKAVGGVSTSQHMKGQAADIQVTSKSDGLNKFKILTKNKYVDQLLFEHSKTAQWLHVSWSKTPRQMFRQNYKA